MDNSLIFRILQVLDICNRLISIECLSSNPSESKCAHTLYFSSAVQIFFLWLAKTTPIHTRKAGDWVITAMIMSHFDLGQTNEFPAWSHCAFDLHSSSSHKNEHNIICILAICNSLSGIAHFFPLPSSLLKFFLYF